MKLRTSGILTLLLFVFLGYTGINTDSHQAEETKLGDQQGIEILQQLLPKAEVFAAGVFNGSGAFVEDKTQTIPGEPQYALVNGEKADTGTGDIRSIAELKQAVEKVYTKEAAEKRFYSRYLAGEDVGLPLYKDYQGKLYVNTQNGGHGYSTKFLYDTVKVISQKGTTVTLSVETLVFDEPYGRMLVTIENVNGEWLMASGLDDYEVIY
jgi:hypothetical protein